MMDKCPYCAAETRQGDNFCLNCGNRLLPATPNPSLQQVQPNYGDATLAESESWGPPASPASAGAGNAWSSAPTVAAGSEPAGAAQATLDRLSEPARFVLRSDNGEILQEYPLDKPEIVIGRAPNSDILLSKDKLTSRRHATVLYDNGQYTLRDEHSANGTFVNGQQLDDGALHALVDGDHVGIGEHELVFYVYGSTSADVENLPTIAVGYEPDKPEMTYRTRDDVMKTVPGDDYNTYATENDEQQPVASPPPVAEYSPSTIPEMPLPSAPDYAASAPTALEFQASEPEEVEEPVELSPVVSPAPVVMERPMQSSPMQSSTPDADAIDLPELDGDVEASFNRFNTLSIPTLPDMSALMAALSAFDGQVMTLQEQFNATQEAFRNHNRDVSQTANQLRGGIRRVTERMDSTIADVARSREALSWVELLQLMDDVMNNPRDIEYVTKLARKARELNKVFQIHQTVLNTMAECNSLLRSMIGDDK